VKDLGAYVIVTSNYTPATCTTGVISSATVPADRPGHRVPEEGQGVAPVPDRSLELIEREAIEPAEAAINLPSLPGKGKEGG
jgi:hypothetical protein